MAIPSQEVLGSYFVRWSGGAEGYAQGLALFAAEATRRDDLNVPELAGEISILLRMPGVEDSPTTAMLATAYSDGLRQIKGSEALVYSSILVMEPAKPEAEDPLILQIAGVRQKMIATRKLRSEASAAELQLDLVLRGYPVRRSPSGAARKTMRTAG